MSEYPARRELSGIFFAIERNGDLKSIDITDMTEEELRATLDSECDKRRLINIVHTLSIVLRQIGDAINVPTIVGPRG